MAGFPQLGHPPLTFTLRSLLIYVSVPLRSLTGTGVPTGKVAAATSDMTGQYPHRVAWLIGVVGVILFIIGGAMSALSGLSAAGARNLLVTSDPSGQSALLSHVVAQCQTDKGNFPSVNISLCDAQGGVGIENIANAVKKCGLNKDISGDCSTIWRAAVAADQDQAWKKYYFSWIYAASAYLTGITAEAGSSSIAAPFLVTVIGIVGLIAALGLGTKGRLAGVWIDPRNRVSLARAQVTLWTIVALSGYLILAMFNVGFADFLASQQDLAHYEAFPTIPGSIIAALGIATGSSVLSPLILGTNKARIPTSSIKILQRPGWHFSGKTPPGLTPIPLRLWHPWRISSWARRMPMPARWMFHGCKTS